MIVATPPHARSRFEFDIPVEPVAPASVEVVGREAAALILQLPACRPDRGDVELHLRLTRRPSAFFEVARRTGSGDIFPCRLPALCARDDMIEGQIIADAAILALKAVAQKHVEPCKRGMLRRLYIRFERDDRRQFHGMRRRMHFALIMIDNVNAVEKHGFYRRLPWPHAQRIIAERGIVSVEHKRRASVWMADKIGVVHALPCALSCPRGPWDQMVTPV